MSAGLSMDERLTMRAANCNGVIWEGGIPPGSSASSSR
jgi:hypothetical protein